VYEKDLGPGPLKVAETMGVFNPDATWKRVDGINPGASVIDL